MAQGEPVLLVHAGVFADWFEPLATSPSLDRYRVIRVRRAGYLPDEPPAHHLTIGDHARHIAMLLDALGIRAAHVCGHSSSALIGLQFAMDRPDSVASLILIDPAPGAVLRAPSQASFTDTVAKPALAAAMAGNVDEAFDTWMAGVAADYRMVLEASLGPDGYRHAVTQSRFFFRDELPAVREWALDRDRAASLAQPVLLILGGKSPNNFRDMVVLLAGILRRVEVSEVDGSGHLLPLQDPDGLAKLITDFATRHPID